MYERHMGRRDPAYTITLTLCWGHTVPSIFHGQGIDMGQFGTSAKFRQFANFIFSGNFFLSEIFQKILQNFRRPKNPGKNFDFFINFLYNISMKSKEREGTIEPFGLSAYYSSPYLAGITSSVAPLTRSLNKGLAVQRISRLKCILRLKKVAPVHSYREPSSARSRKRKKRKFDFS